ncbi:hypothetical protein [Paenibacillus agilis]|uniref:Uncharacterized protein n=1 Tax=Paenibacillus agilis TaxID=3020863 RepID=A0A559J0V7_9BACL|nr:hypothetical protein [Paenibacillus agilis]TVX93483.1 hypothetical protein FPZ44_10710 [Paenibacillus agilis]
MFERRGYVKRLVVVGLSCLMLLFSPAHASASSVGWEAALSTVEQLHDSLSALELANQLDKQKIQLQRKQNNEKRKEVDRKIQLIDKVKVDHLKTEAERTENKHAPLLAKYKELGKKASEARKRKDKKAALRYDLERNRIKASANTARQEIKMRKDTLTAAKKQVHTKAKLVREALEPIQTIKKQITAENKKMTDIFSKNKTAANKRYRTAIKQGDAVTAAVELNIIVAELARIHASQKKIYEWEGNIHNMIRAADAKL